MNKRGSPEKGRQLVSGTKGLLKTLCFTMMSCALLVVSGCVQEPTEQASVKDYIWRLSNVLDYDYQTPPVNVAAYPRTRDLTLKVSDHSIDLLDFLAMTGCQLQITAGQRNSGLGRVMSNSQSFLYQWRFIQESGACLAYLKDEDPTLYQTLAAVVEVKKAELSRYAWLALWGGPELKQYFGVSQQWLSPQQPLALTPDTYNIVLDVIAMDANALKDVALYETAFEEALYEFQLRNTGGQWLATLAGLTQYLQLGTAMLTSETGQRLCPKGKVTPKAKILKTVFDKFYIGQVQPYLSFVHRNSETWWQQQTAMLEVFTFKGPEAFEQFVSKYLNQDRDDGLWQRYERAQRSHVVAWQSVLRQCGLMPGA